MKRITLFALLAMLLAGCSGESDYVASSQREPFHRTSCEWAQKIAAANKETYSTREDAIAAGHRACRVCRP